MGNTRSLKNPGKMGIAHFSRVLATGEVEVGDGIQEVLIMWVARPDVRKSVAVRFPRPSRTQGVPPQFSSVPPQFLLDPESPRQAGKPDLPASEALMTRPRASRWAMRPEPP